MADKKVQLKDSTKTNNLNPITKWECITNAPEISGKADTSIVPSVVFGTCSTGASTSAKIVEVSSTTKFELTVGAIVCVRFTYSNSATNVKLNVNNTGEKSLYYGSAVLTNANTIVTGYAGRSILYMYDGTYWVWLGMSAVSDSNTIPAGYCSSSSSANAKAATWSDYNLLANTYGMVTIKNANTSKTALTLNINSKGSKPIYINGTASSTTNYTLPAGVYVFFYDGTNYYFRTDGKIEGLGATHTHTKSQITDLPTIPTKTSDLTNDSGFITSSYHDGTKQDTISDLATIRSNASSGASKVSCTDATVGGFGYTKNNGTVTSVAVKINGTVKGTVTSSGTIDLGTVSGSVGTLNTNITTAQSVSSSESFSNTIKLHKVSKTGSYNDLLNKPTIPDVSGKANLSGGNTFSGTQTFTTTPNVNGTNIALVSNTAPASIGTSTVLINVGSKSMSFKDYSGEITLAEIINHIFTCYRGDTTYITMADGSKKLIQDVKVGDMVKGFNPNTEQEEDQVVLDNILTGKETNFDLYVFDNGKTLDIFGNEKVLRMDNFYIGLDSIANAQETTGHRAGLLIRTLDGGTKLRERIKRVKVKKPTARYSLITSNTTFYANGVLHACEESYPVDAFARRGRNIPDYIQSVYNKALEKMYKMDESLDYDTFCDSATQELYNNYKACDDLILKAKELLNKTDYKAMKYAEDAITEEEWLPVKQARAEARATINEQEAQKEVYKEKLEKKAPMLLHGNDKNAKKESFKYATNIFAQNINLFKKWADEMNATIIE